MQISVQHQISVALGEGVGRAVQHLLLTPQSGPAQTVREWRVEVEGLDDPHGFMPPGGESHLDLRHRSAAVLADVMASATRTVIVGHGVSGAVVRGLNLGLDARAMFVLEKPQDAFFRLLDGSEHRITCDL